MNLQELEKEAREELEVEKKDIAKDILKSRIVEIEKAEKMLARLKGQYQGILGKSVEELVDEVIDGNIRIRF
jgi:hypothetical protein